MSDTWDATEFLVLVVVCEIKISDEEQIGSTVKDHLKVKESGSDDYLIIQFSSINFIAPAP